MKAIFLSFQRETQTSEVAFLKRHTDHFKCCTEACRQQGKELFIQMRRNAVDKHKVRGVSVSLKGVHPLQLLCFCSIRTVKRFHNWPEQPLWEAIFSAGFGMPAVIYEKASKQDC